MWINLRRVNEHHNQYLAVIGRGLAVAQHLEATLRFVLITVETVEAGQRGELNDWDDWKAIGDRVRKLFLKQIVHKINRPLKLSGSDLTLLEAGREVRNFLAHEAAVVVSEYPDSSDDIAQKVKDLQVRLRTLADADNLVSGWSYEIQEKEPSPKAFSLRYANEVVRWILDPLNQAM